MEGIIIHSQLDKTTLSKGIKAVLNNALAVKITKILGYLMIVGSIVIYIFVVKLASYAPLQGVFIGLIFVFFANIMTFFNVRRIPENDRVYEKLTYEFTPKVILIKGDTFEGYLNWEDIKEVVETEDFFLFYQSKLGANIIPKAAFTNEKAEKFRRLILAISGLKNNFLD